MITFCLCALSLQAQDIKPSKVKNSKVSTLVRDLQDRELPVISLQPKEEEKSSAVDEALISSIISYAKKHLGYKYRSGGKGPKAFDCSGFVGYVWGHFGYKMASSSSAQYHQGEEVNRNDLKPGDLLFFNGRARGGSVGHVGMVVSVNPDTKAVKFIHAATSVGIKIDSYPDGGYYSARYVGAKRIIPN